MTANPIKTMAKNFDVLNKISDKILVMALSFANMIKRHILKKIYLLYLSNIFKNHGPYIHDFLLS